MITKNHILFIVFMFLYYDGFSHNKVIDSLKLELLIDKVKDTIKVNLLNDLAFSYLKNSIPRSLEY